jgi:hypothetical protein
LDEQKKKEKSLKEKSIDSSPSGLSFAVSDDGMEALALIEKGRETKHYAC